MVPEMNDVMDAAIKYNGGKHCTVDKEVLKKVRDTLVNAKPNWVSMEYSTIDKMVKGDFLATSDWNGSAMRQRLQNPDIKYGYPKEGFRPGWTMLPCSRMPRMWKTPSCSKISSWTRRMRRDFRPLPAIPPASRDRTNIMPADMKDAPELTIPKEMEGHYEFSTACPPEATEIYTKIWTEVLK